MSEQYVDDARKYFAETQAKDTLKTQDIAALRAHCKRVMREYDHLKAQLEAMAKEIVTHGDLACQSCKHNNEWSDYCCDPIENCEHYEIDIDNLAEQENG